MLLKFKRNTVYEGESYGPSYPETVADVQKPWIATFLAQSRAEPLTDEERAAYLARKAGKKAGGTSTPPAPAGKCAGVTKTGNPCRSKAVEGSDFCAAHQDQAEGGEDDDDDEDED
jgi:hypothetical protein